MTEHIVICFLPQLTSSILSYVKRGRSPALAAPWKWTTYSILKRSVLTAVESKPERLEWSKRLTRTAPATDSSADKAPATWTGVCTKKNNAIN